MDSPPGGAADREKRFEAVVAEYFRVAESGAPPTEEELRQRYPDLADLVSSFFAAQDGHEPKCHRPASPEPSVADSPTITVCGADTASQTDAPSLPPEGSLPGSSAAKVRGRRLGDYELLEEIGHGGMGVVYKARQISLNRIVALKMIRAGELASTEELSRFIAEAQAAAGFDHVGIVPIYEVGQHNGQPYYSMGFVEGQSLSELLRNGPLPPRDAADIVRQVAEAVQYAHDRGVIHRDLKPSNILLPKSKTAPAHSESGISHSDVSHSRARGYSLYHPKVTDFGLAKRLEGGSELTSTGQVLGTPSYMPPEQATGAVEQVGPAADIYALGAVLYCLLTGRPPFQAANPLDTLRQVVEAEPIAPRQLNHAVPRDLETIALKCLRKEPKARYGSALELAAELERFLNGEPIQARPIGRLSRAWRWCCRRPLVAGLLAVAVTSLLGGAAASTWFWRQAERKAIEASHARDEATTKLWGSLLAQAQAGRWSGQAGRRFDSWDALARAAAIRPSTELRNEALECLALADFRALPGLAIDMREVLATDWEPAMRWCACGEKNGRIRIRQADDGAELACLEGANQPAHVIKFSPDGRYLAAKHHPTLVDAANVLEVWDWKQQVKTLTLPSGVDNNAFDFSFDSRRLAVGRGKSIRVYDLATSKLQRTIPCAAPPHTIAFDPAAGRLAVSSLATSTVQIVSYATGEPTLSLKHPQPVRVVAWHPSGQRVATACADGQVYVWHVADGEPLEPRLVLRGHDAVTTSVAFNPAGSLLASIGWDGNLILWNASNGDLLVRTPGVLLRGSLRFGGDDSRLASWATSNSLGLWEVATGHERRILPHDPAQRTWCVQVSADGRLLAHGRGDGVKLWDVAAAREIAWLRIGVARCAFFHPRGDGLVTWGPAGLLRWPLRFSDQAERTLVEIGPPENLGVAASNLAEWGGMSANGRIVAVADRGHGHVVVFDLDAKKVLKTHRHVDASEIAVSPDGRWIAGNTWGAAEGLVRVWNVASGELAAQWSSPNGTAVGFTSDSRQFVTGLPNEYEFRHVGSWEKLRSMEIQGGGGGARPLAVARDAGLVALHASPTTVRLLEPTDLRELATFSAGVPYCLTPDGGLLVTLSPKQGLQLWDLREIRRQLKAIDLDWEGREFADKPARWSKPLTAKVHQQSSDDKWLALNSECWKIVRNPKRTGEQYRKAADLAEALLSGSANNAAYLNTVGVAQYRAGKFAAAIETLQRSDELYLATTKTAHPANRAFSAMARHKLGETKPALADLARLWPEARRGQWAKDDDAVDAVREAEWTLLVEPAKWTPLEPLEFSSTGGAKLRKLDDSSLLAEGENPSNDTYRIVAKTALQRVTALRLDVLKHESLPKLGPGRVPDNGTFALTGVELTARCGAEAKSHPVAFRYAWADYAQPGHDPLGLVGISPPNGWAIHRSGDLPLSEQALVLDFEKPIVHEDGATLTVTLKHGSQWKEANLGRFRLSVTDGERPPLPASQDAAPPK